LIPEPTKSQVQKRQYGPPVQRPKGKLATSIGSTPSPSTSGHSGSGHRVFTCLQKDKLLMGGERELSQINISITMLLGLWALMNLNWHLAVVAVLFGGPVQAAIRILSERDADYMKTYLEALRIPHIRSPE
jgi:type IV secretory pathway TrbD component